MLEEQANSWPSICRMYPAIAPSRVRCTVTYLSCSARACGTVVTRLQSMRYSGATVGRLTAATHTSLSDGGLRPTAMRCFSQALLAIAEHDIKRASAVLLRVTDALLLI